MDALTNRQRRVLAALEAFGREHGYMPTVRELGGRLGLRSSCTVQRYLEGLERKGYLRRQPRKSRAVRLLKDAAGRDIGSDERGNGRLTAEVTKGGTV